MNARTCKCTCSCTRNQCVRCGVSWVVVLERVNDVRGFASRPPTRTHTHKHTTHIFGDNNAVFGCKLCVCVRSCAQTRVSFAPKTRRFINNPWSGMHARTRVRSARSLAECKLCGEPVRVRIARLGSRAYAQLS